MSLLKASEPMTSISVREAAVPLETDVSDPHDWEILSEMGRTDAGSLFGVVRCTCRKCGTRFATMEKVDALELSETRRTEEEVARSLERKVRRAASEVHPRCSEVVLVREVMER